MDSRCSRSTHTAGRVCHSHSCCTACLGPAGTHAKNHGLPPAGSAVVSGFVTENVLSSFSKLPFSLPSALELALNEKTLKLESS